DSLCGDGVDNDGDGLADCQDFKCLGQPVCCDQPVILFADDFTQRACAATDCATPDVNCTLGDGWQAWGLPMPALCGGGLTPMKTQICYDVGALAQTMLQLHPGMSIWVRFAGVPEVAGRLVVGLTKKDLIASGTTECGPIEGLS